MAKIPKMERRHFEFLAQCMKSIYERQGEAAYKPLYELAVKLRPTNERFQLSRFLDAAGLPHL